jgi:hypothetical protein
MRPREARPIVSELSQVGDRPVNTGVANRCSCEPSLRKILLLFGRLRVALQMIVDVGS